MKIIALDTETKSLTDHTLIAFSYCDGEKTVVVPVRMNTVENITIKKAQQKLSDLITNNIIVFHNASFDIPVLVQFGISLDLFNNIHDTLIISNLINENINHGLKFLVNKYFKHKMTEYKQVCGTGKKQIQFEDVDWKIAENYAGEDAHWTWELFNFLYKELKKDEKVFDLYEQIERPLLKVVADMHIGGITIDVNQVKDIADMCKQKIDEAKVKLDYLMEDINLDSPKQLREFFINKKHLRTYKVSRRTEEPSVDSEVLKRYAEEGSQEARLLLQYRKYKKILSTFIPALIPKDWKIVICKGKVYPSFNQAGTVSGRFSCVPLDTKILTKNGWKKYSQLDLDEEVAGYNFNTKKLEWTTLKYINVYKNVDVGLFSWRHYKGHSKQQNQGVYCTGNHKWLCNIQNVNGYIESQNINTKKNFLHNYILTAKGLSVENEDSILSIAESGILGWALTDGHIIKLKNGYSCDIQVLKKSSLEYLQRLLKETKHNYNKYYRGREYHNRYRHRFYIPKEIFTDIWEKYLFYKETLIFELSEKCKSEMFNSMLEADGTPRKVTKSFYAQKDDVSNLFSILTFTLGYKINNKQYHKIVKQKGYSNIGNSFSITKKQYEKHVYYKSNIKKCDVWCPTTRLGNWVMKQNNNIVITGNSSNPNFQNIPNSDKLGLRKAIVADEGHVLVGADYSQIELRVLAHFSQDFNLMKAYNEGEDIHQKTADACGIDRNKAKTINFGLVYGMGAKTLSKRINVSYDEAKEYMRRYFQTYPRVKELWNEIEQKIRNDGYIETAFNRKRRRTNYFFAKDNYEQYAEIRSMSNMLIQGSAADLMKIAMINMYPQLKKYGARIISTVHDEVIVSTPKDKAKQVYAVIHRAMVEAGQSLSVKIEVDVKIGNNWEEVH